MSQYTNIRRRIRRAWAELSGRPNPAVMTAYRYGVNAGHRLERIELGLDDAGLPVGRGRHLHLV
jgi:hypothetical protein